MNIYLQMCVCVYTHIHMYKHMHICICKYIHIPSYADKYTHLSHFICDIFICIYLHV